MGGISSQENSLEELKQILGRSPDLRTLVALEDLSPTHRLREDLGMDSLCLMGLVYELQDLYPRIEVHEMNTWTTVQDLIGRLEEVRG